MRSCLKLFTLIITLSASSIAFAEEAPEKQRDWSITISPRVQQLLFLPDADADGLESLTSIGASVAVRNQDGRYGLVLTALGGKGSGTYSFHTGTRTGQFAYRGLRREFSALGEYSPSETNVTIIAGYHSFAAKADESLINSVTDSETNSYRFSIDAAEVGLRLSSRLSAQSRHAVSAQFSAGIGQGHFKENENSSVGGTARSSVRNKSGFGYVGDAAFGYNYFLTKNLTIGGRGRAYLFYVQTKGSYPIFAVTPELNMSFRF